jgi:hypothetical protein
MTSPGLAPRARPIAASCFRQVRQRLAALRGFRREVAARACERLRRETRVPLQARDSHPVADGPWCTGTAQVTDADTMARPHATHNQRGAYESLSYPRPGPGPDGDRRLGQSGASC